MSKKNISSVVVADETDDWKEWAALQGASLSVDAVLSSGLLTICTDDSVRLGFSAPGFAKEKWFCMGDRQAGELAVLFS